LVFRQIEDRQVVLCRYFEEYYNRVMSEGGGLMEKLDEAEKEVAQEELDTLKSSLSEALDRKSTRLNSSHDV
jgi:hypothetical protein